MKIGIVYNSNAGNSVLQKEALNALEEKLRLKELFCTISSYPFLKETLPEIKCIGDNRVECSFMDSVRAGMILNEMDLIIVFGGDGTVADVVSGQRKTGKLVPIMGIGCGTANAGPLIFTGKIEVLKSIDFEKLEKVNVCGLDVYDENNELVGTAFNDLVFSDCLVSTMEDSVVTVCARSFLEGKRICKTPTFIGTKATLIEINEKETEIPFDIGQIILSPINNKENFSCKAIFGKICWLAYSDKNAAMIISQTPIIKLTGSEDLDAGIPAILSQFIFGSEDRLKISGTRGFAIIDGNPRIDMEMKGSAANIILNNTAAQTVKSTPPVSI